MKVLAKAKETSEALQDGWLHTGDIGSFDADGFLMITAARRTSRHLGGKKIAPQPIEAALKASPRIQEALVRATARSSGGDDRGRAGASAKPSPRTWSA